MLNQTVIQGRFTANPELRSTKSGVPVCSFRIACERDFKSSGGDKKTDFIDVVCYRNTAEFVSKYFSRGTMANIFGRLQVNEFVDKDGNKRRSAEVIAENVYFCERKQSDTQTPTSDFAELEDDSDTLPF